MSSVEPQTETWEELRNRAKQIVDALITRLPDELRPEALRIGYELHKRCRDEHVLGTYTQCAHLIQLYLEAIREDCIAESRDFSTELERTYLHELGHHLGLDEEHVERYGL
jgi:predicted Zn-dependent protease with MMP-like domain